MVLFFQDFYNLYKDSKTNLTWIGFTVFGERQKTNKPKNKKKNKNKQVNKHQKRVEG